MDLATLIGLLGAFGIVSYARQQTQQKEKSQKSESETRWKHPCWGPYGERCENARVWGRGD